MTDLAEIVKHAILHDTHLLDWRGRIPATPDESWHAVGHNSGDSGDIPIAQRIQQMRKSKS